MPYIKVDTDKIRSYTTELETTRQKINYIRQDILRARQKLDWELPGSTVIESRMEDVEDKLEKDAYLLTNMRVFLNQTANLYDGEEEQRESVLKKAASIAGGLFELVSPVKDTAVFIKDVIKAGKEAKKMTYILKNGKMYLSGYQKASGLTSRYNYSTWINKGATKDAKVGKLGFALSAVGAAAGLGVNLYGVWTDENKTTEKKVYDTVANVYCAGASLAIDTGGKIVGKIASGAVSAACCAIPVVGPVVGVVAGAVTSVVVEGAIGILADTFTSEAVVNQVSDSIENVVGAAKAGGKAISDASKKLMESKNAGEAIANTANLVGQAVVAGAKVVATAVVESVKTAATVVVETVKNVGKAIGDFFKKW